MLLRRTVTATLLPLALAACNGATLPGLGGAPEAPVVPTAVAGQPGVSPLDVPLEVEGARTTLGTANAAASTVTAFTATGPGWLAAVRGGNGAVRRADQRDVQINLRRVDFAQGVEFVGVVGERTATLNLRATACRDAGGGTWPMTASLRLGGNTLTGCAAPTGSEPGSFSAELPTIRPVAAPKPAAAKPAAPRRAAPAEAAPTPVTPAATAPATPTPVTPEPAASTPPTPAAPAAAAPTPVAPEAAAPQSATPAVTVPAAPAPATAPTPVVPPAAPDTPAATTPTATTPAPVVLPVPTN